MNICVFHPRFASRIGAALRSAFPDCTIHAVPDVSQDPPQAAEIEVLIANRFPRGLLGRMPRLRWLQLTSVGTDHVAEGAPGPELVVTHAGSVPAVAVAEFVMMALLGLAKDTRTLIHQQAARVWKLPDARRIAGTTLVVLGIGRIGSEIARRAAPFGVRVIAVRRSGAPSPHAERVVTPRELAEVLPLADHLVVTLPATAETNRLLSREMLALLPPHAVVVSIGRASVLDVGALVEALHQERLRGALLDVHETEPLPEEHPLWREERLWITPHCAYEYPEQVEDLARLCAENLARYRAGLPLINLLSGTI